MELTSRAELARQLKKHVNTIDAQEQIIADLRADLLALQSSSGVEEIRKQAQAGIEVAEAQRRELREALQGEITVLKADAITSASQHSESRDTLQSEIDLLKNNAKAKAALQEP